MLVRMRVRWRATARRCRLSAAGLAGMSAARLPERHAARVVARGDGQPARERPLAADEVLQRVREPPHAPTMIRDMADERVVRTKHADLSLEQIAELLPGTGEIMQ